MKIALIGTGLMGFPMAENILEKNFDLTVHNRTIEKILPLEKLGQRSARMWQKPFDIRM